MQLYTRPVGRGVLSKPPFWPPKDFICTALPFERYMQLPTMKTLSQVIGYYYKYAIKAYGII